MLTIPRKLLSEKQVGRQFCDDAYLRTVILGLTILEPVGKLIHECHYPTAFSNSYTQVFLSLFVKFKLTHLRTGSLMSSLSQSPCFRKDGASYRIKSFSGQQRLTKFGNVRAWKWLTGNALVSISIGGVTLQKIYEFLISSLYESRLTVWYSIYNSLGLRPFITLFLPFCAMSWSRFDGNSTLYFP